MTNTQAIFAGRGLYLARAVRYYMAYPVPSADGLLSHTRKRRKH
jgi:hypothetical protein